MNETCKVCGRPREDHVRTKMGSGGAVIMSPLGLRSKIKSESDRKIDSINRIAQFERGCRVVR